MCITRCVLGFYSILSMQIDTIYIAWSGVVQSHHLRKKPAAEMDEWNQRVKRGVSTNPLVKYIGPLLDTGLGTSMSGGPM